MKGNVMRKAGSVICCCMMVFAFSCSKKEKDMKLTSSAPINFKIGHDGAEGVPCSLALARFKELVEKKTDGAIQISVYNNGTLGSANDYIVNCQLGTLDMGSVNQSVLSSFVPDLAAMDIPYLLKDYAQADACYTGKVGQYYMDETSSLTDLEVLAIWEVGYRVLTNDKHPVNKMADIKGLRIRTMDNKIHQDFWKSLGADPVPMSWGEAYTALQQGAIDGCENAISMILGNNVAEVNKHLAITNHVYSSQFLIIGKKSWEKLSDEQKKIMRECALEAGQYEREVQRKQAGDAVEKLKEKGMKVTYPEISEFTDYAKTFKKKYESQYKNVLDLVEETAR